MDRLETSTGRSVTSTTRQHTGPEIFSGIKVNRPGGRGVTHKLDQASLHKFTFSGAGYFRKNVALCECVVELAYIVRSLTSWPLSRGNCERLCGKVHCWAQNDSARKENGKSLLFWTRERA